MRYLTIPLFNILDTILDTKTNTKHYDNIDILLIHFCM